MYTLAVQRGGNEDSRGVEAAESPDSRQAIDVCGPACKAPSSPPHHGDLSRHGCTSNMQSAAFGRGGVVEGNGTMPLAPSCGPSSGNFISNTRAATSPWP